MNIVGLIYLFLAHPIWFWHVVWYRILNPENLFKHHIKQSLEYMCKELELREAVQKITFSNIKEIDSILQECQEFRLPEFSTNQLIPKRFDASEMLVQLCYSVIRITKPSIVVETGVARGITTTYILKALDMNKIGHLYSIELPILMPYAWKEVGKIVPDSLRRRWTLVFGPGTHEMKKLQKNIANIDIFVHDSEHTYSNQLAEYKIASSWLKKGGIIISDDVDNDALLEISEKTKGSLVIIKQEDKRKSKYLGILTQ